MAKNDSLYFTFNGRQSSDLGLTNVTLSSGFNEDKIVSGRELQTITINGKDEALVYSISDQPLSLTVTAAFSDMSKTQLREIKKWLLEKKFSNLIFSDEPEKAYYCTVVGDITQHTVNGKDGYLTINFISKFPYMISSKVFNTKPINVEGEYILDFYNEGDLPIKPYLSFLLNNNDDVVIENLVTGQIFSIKDIPEELGNIEIGVDNENSIISTSNKVNLYRLHNKEWLELKEGFNRLKINGNFTFNMAYILKYYP